MAGKRIFEIPRRKSSRKRSTWSFFWRKRIWSFTRKIVICGTYSSLFSKKLLKSGYILKNHFWKVESISVWSGERKYTFGFSIPPNIPTRVKDISISFLSYFSSIFSGFSGRVSLKYPTLIWEESGFWNSTISPPFPRIFWSQTYISAKAGGGMENQRKWEVGIIILEWYPVNTKKFPIFFGHSIKYTSICLDSFPGSCIIIISTQENPLKSYLSCLIESESEHMFSISPPSRTGTKSISDMPSRISQIWMIYMVSYLYGSKNILTFHKKEESTIHSSWIISKISRDDRDKFFICISRKKSSWTCRCKFWWLPLVDHINIRFFMQKIWKQKMEHRYY